MWWKQDEKKKILKHGRELKIKEKQGGEKGEEKRRKVKNKVKEEKSKEKTESV